MTKLYMLIHLLYFSFYYSTVPAGGRKHGAQNVNCEDFDSAGVLGEQRRHVALKRAHMETRTQLFLGTQRLVSEMNARRQSPSDLGVTVSLSDQDKQQCTVRLSDLIGRNNDEISFSHQRP